MTPFRQAQLKRILPTKGVAREESGEQRGRDVKVPFVCQIRGQKSEEHMKINVRKR